MINWAAFDHVLNALNHLAKGVENGKEEREQKFRRRPKDTSRPNPKPATPAYGRNADDCCVKER